MCRTGFGYDVHRLAKGEKLILGGVNIDFELGTVGHSDADVLLHAIIDALLGAAAMRDIGYHFPDTDAQYKGISSLELLRRTKQILEDNNFKINNIDATLVLQKPKIKDYIPQMIENIANTLNINTNQVNVKATTTEHLGFEGRSEGISAYAVVSLDNK